MAEDLIKIEGTRQEKYDLLFPQIKNLLAGETDKYANLAIVEGTKEWERLTATA